MTDPVRCAEAEDLISEVALGVATAQDRARLLAHVSTCTRCRALLAESSEMADELLALGPVREPPAGFESQVLARLRTTGGWRGWPRRLAATAAVAVVAATLSGGAVYWADRSDRELAARVRNTLATAQGQYFTAIPVQDVAGTRRGALFAYQGQPAWVFLTVRGPVGAGEYTIEIITRAGVRYRLADRLDLSGTRSWGATIPVAVHEISVLRVTQNGRLIFSARLPAH